MSNANEKREMPKQKKRGWRIALIVLGILTAMVLVAVGAWKILVVPPDVSGNNRPGVTEQTGTTTPETTAPDNIGSSETEIEGETEPQNGRKQDYYTFILLGKDTGGGSNTDTMILVSYDVPNGTIDLVSIPRDTMINVPWKIKKINAVYASSRGIEGLKTELGHLTGVTPDFYITVEWEAIGEIVDALGGVWFDVPYDMNYDDPYQDLYIHQEKGYRFLNGDDAMQVIRWRKNNGEKYGIGDSGRQQVQQDFLKAVAKQCLQIKNWTKVSAFAEIFFENIETDIAWNNVLWFAQQAMGMSVENINFHSLPGNDQGWYYTPSVGGNLAYFFADPAGIVELVNAHFNPFTQDITEEDLQIVFKNKDASLGVTNGELADPKMAIPSVKPPSPPKTDDETDDEETADEESDLPAEGEDETEGEDGAKPPSEGDGSGEGDAPAVDENGEADPAGDGETGEEGADEMPPETPASGETEQEEPASGDASEGDVPPEEPVEPPEDGADGDGSGTQTE